MQQGGITPQHLTMWSDFNVIMDGGNAGQMPQGLQPTERGLMLPAGRGHGPNGENDCLYDSPVGVAGHYLCLSANVGGNAVLNVGALGGATQGGFVVNVNGQSIPVPGSVTGLPQVLNNAALKAEPSTFAAWVVRSSFAVSGDAPPLLYYSSGSPCTQFSGAGDNGWQVKSADNKCWIAVFPTSGVDVREFGTACNGNGMTGAGTDDSVAFQNAANVAIDLTALLRVPQCGSGYLIKSQIVAQNLSTQLSGLHVQAEANTYIWYNASTGFFNALGNSFGQFQQFEYENGYVVPYFGSGAGGAYTPGSGWAFHIQNAGFFKISRINFLNTYIAGYTPGVASNGIWVDFANNSGFIENNNMEGLGTAIQFGNLATGLTIRDNDISLNFGNAIQCSGGSTTFSVWISGNYFENNARAYSCPGGQESVGALQFHDNYVHNYNNPISWTGSISGNTLTATGVTGQINPGVTIASGAAAGTKVLSFDQGGGTFVVTPAQTVTSTAMTGTTNNDYSIYDPSGVGNWYKNNVFQDDAATISTILASSGQDIVTGNRWFYNAPKGTSAPINMPNGGHVSDNSFQGTPPNVVGCTGPGCPFYQVPATSATTGSFQPVSFTPVFKGNTAAGTGTYSVQLGTATLTNNQVHLTIDLLMTAQSGMTGTLQVGGAPWPVTTNGNYACAFGFMQGLIHGASMTQWSAFLNQGTSNITIEELGSNTQQPVPIANLALPTRVVIDCWYMTQ
jgi:hypothetical protein